MYNTMAGITNAPEYTYGRDGALPIKTDEASIICGASPNGVDLAELGRGSGGRSLSDIRLHSRLLPSHIHRRVKGAAVRHLAI